MAKVCQLRPISSRRHSVLNSFTSFSSTDSTNSHPNTNSSTSSTSSADPTPRQPSKFDDTLQMIQSRSLTNNSVYTSDKLSDFGTGAHYKSWCSPISPANNHINERARITINASINHSIDDDKTSKLLQYSPYYAKNDPAHERRPTNPQIPISHMSGFSQDMMSSVGIVSDTPVSNQLRNQHYQRHNSSLVYLADQNLPCNTLYVGNLLINASEDELKCLFSTQLGYKRLCFRTKQSGSMCFVESQDASFATKALHKLNGYLLRNSIKGGIRLNFSKNPLGVRSKYRQAISPPLFRPASNLSVHSNTGYQAPSVRC